MSRFSHIILGLTALLLTGAPAVAQEMTEEEMVKALMPQKTRSLSIGALPAAPSAPAADVAFVDTLRNRKSGTVNSDTREKLKLVAADKLAINVKVEFDFRSDELHGSALQGADKLGRVLSDSKLANQTFVIAGHTDAKGSAEVNQKLSERRAEAVKRYLVQHYKLPAANLIAVGYGETRLKKPSDPDSAENRRVEAVNILEVQTAGR